MFSRDTLFIIPLGSLKGKVRREIIQNRVSERGAKIVDNAKDANIIVASNETSRHLLEQRVLSNPSALVVDVSWITDSIAGGSRMDPVAYCIPIGDTAIPKPVTRKAEHIEDVASQSSSRKKVSVKTPAENEQLATLFDELETLAASSPGRTDAFRAMAYRKAAAVVREHERPIKTDSDAEDLRDQLGEKTIEKVKEFVHSGTIMKAELLEQDSFATARKELQGVWGIGPSVANELVLQGFDSVEKLRDSGQQLLNANQKTGLRFYEELLPKMPRSEVEEISRVVADTTRKLFGDDLEMIVCGSYRRGAPFSSDADFLFSWKKGVKARSPKDTIHALVESMKDSHFLIDYFNKVNHHTVFLGICRLGPGRQARRLDMKVWPRDSLACAMMHFTGNADFNRRIRLFAKQHGLKLSDLGLTKSDGETVECKSEEDVFSALALPYIPPEERTSAVAFKGLDAAE